MLHIKIITPLGLYLECEGESIHVATVEGETTLLPNHMPLVAMLKPCRCVLRIDGKNEVYALSGGLLQLADNEARILTDAIEGRAEIDIERARRARERAEKRLAKKDDKTDLQRAEVALKKAINRIHVYEK